MDQTVAVLVVLIGLWDLAIRIFHIPPYQIPAPIDVIKSLWNDWPELLAQAWPTTCATLAGFLLSALFGIPVAMLIAASRTVESFVYPLLVFSQSVPKIAIAPLLVVWFGFDIVPKIICAFMLGFFPIVVSSVQGFKSVDPDMIDLVRAMRANRLQIYRAVSLPHAMPAIFTGLRSVGDARGGRCRVLENSSAPTRASVTSCSAPSARSICR